MAEIHVTAERTIDAPAERVYAALADVADRAAWLPPAYSDVHLERREEEQGTILRYHLDTGRRARDYRLDVTRPEPGRTVREADTESSLVKTYTVQPEGDRSRVRIDTTWQGSGGVGGFFERTFAPRVLQRLYEDELARLDRYVHQSDQS